MNKQQGQGAVVVVSLPTERGIICRSMMMVIDDDGGDNGGDDDGNDDGELPIKARHDMQEQGDRYGRSHEEKTSHLRCSRNCSSPKTLCTQIRQRLGEPVKTT